jgi:AraC-like DNA-binding protein
MEAGAVYIVPSGLRLSSRNSAVLTQFFIHFDIEDIPPAVLRQLFPLPMRVPDETGVQRLMADLLRNLDHTSCPAAASRAMALGAVYAALGHCLAALPPEIYTRFWDRMSALNPVLPALQYIQENLHLPMSNAKLARLCHLSEDHFIRTFGELVGQPPSRYIRKRRIAQAAQKLLLTDLSVGQIAAQCGFSDRFYFSRAFAQEVGVPPVMYRKRPRV